MPLSLDNGLIQDARAGGAGLERLIEAVWPEAYRIAWSVLRDRGLAEDAAQEACASMARALPALGSDDRFAAWAYKIIVNQALTASRRRAQVRALDEALDRPLKVDEGDAIDLDRALRTLPVTQRSVVILHYYAGLNSKEIAAATGLNSSTVRFHLMLARRTLRKALEVADACAAHAPKEMFLS